MALNSGTLRPERMALPRLPVGLPAAFTMAGVWSFQATTWTWRSRMRASASSRPSRLKASKRRCQRWSHSSDGRRRPSVASSDRPVAVLRRPGSHDQVRPWRAVVIPLAASWRSASSRPTAGSTMTPGRGMTQRSKASPWMSTRPGARRRWPRSSPSAGAPGLDGGDPLALDHERGGADPAVGMENAAAVEAHALALIDEIGCRP